MSADDVDRLRAIVAGAEPAGPCPPAEALARVAAGEATSSERDLVVDHLTGCAACSEEYRVAASLMPWIGGAESDLVMPGARATVRRRALTFGYAAAAVLLVAISLGVVAWALSLRAENARLTTRLQEASRLSSAVPRGEATRESAEAPGLQAKLNEALAPALNVPIIDLLPIDAVRGPGSRSVPRVPAGARLVTFVITTASIPAAIDHELEIVGPSGAALWRGAGLRPNSERAFTVTVPRALFPSGTSRLRLYAGQKLVADHSISVAP